MKNMYQMLISNDHFVLISDYEYTTDYNIFSGVLRNEINVM